MHFWCVFQTLFYRRSKLKKKTLWGFVISFNMLSKKLYECYNLVWSVFFRLLLEFFKISVVGVELWSYSRCINSMNVISLWWLNFTEHTFRFKLSDIIIFFYLHLLILLLIVAQLASNIKLESYLVYILGNSILDLFSYLLLIHLIIGYFLRALACYSV